MTKKNKRRISRLIALALTLLMLALPLFSVFADGSVIPARVSGIYDNQTYMLKNKASGLYLTLPDYTEATDTVNPKTNVYQYPKRVNDQYSRAVKITYSPNNGLYTISGVIFQSFDSENAGRVTFSSTDNVYLDQTSNGSFGEWLFVYNDEQQGFRILNQSGKAITASGYAYGSASTGNLTVSGNVYVSSEQLGNYQIWELEAVTVNPHLVKDTETIEKKNIGRGSEWLFRLRDSEVGVRTIQNVTAVINDTDIVTIAHNSDGFIVKIKETNDAITDSYSKYALIKVTLDNGVIRYVMVQDAGTGSGDACRTIPIYKYSRYSTVTIPENGTKDFMITLTSEIGGKPVTRWEISDDWVVVQDTYNGKLLNGTSYIVITARNLGFSLVSAYVDHDDDSSTADVAYSVLVEVQQEVSDGVLVHPYVLTLENTNAAIELGYGRKYLMKTTAFVKTSVLAEGESVDELWRLDYTNTLSLICAGQNYAVIQTATQDEFEEANDTVTPERYYNNGVMVPLTTGLLDVEFAFQKNRKHYIDSGNYYVQNVRYEDRFMQAVGYNEETYTVLGAFDTTPNHYWNLTYLDNGYYKITLADSMSALTIPENAIDDENTPLILDSYDSASSRYHWRITYNGSGGYTLKNRATIYGEDFNNYIICLHSVLEGEVGNPVVNGRPKADCSDEWLFITSAFTNDHTYDNNIVNDNEVLAIGYWKYSPKVSVSIEYDKYFSPTITEREYIAGVEYAIDLWNEALGTSITLVSDEDDADINIVVTTPPAFVPEGVRGYTTSDNINCYYKLCNNTDILVRSIVSATIQIYEFENTQIMYHTLLHELGHALGYMSHSTVQYDMMYHSLTTYITLSGSDKNALRYIYDEHHIGGTQ